MLRAKLNKQISVLPVVKQWGLPGTIARECVFPFLSFRNVSVHWEDEKETEKLHPNKMFVFRTAALNVICWVSDSKHPWISALEESAGSRWSECDSRLYWTYHWREPPQVSFLSWQKFCRRGQNMILENPLNSKQSDLSILNVLAATQHSWNWWLTARERSI